MGEHLTRQLENHYERVENGALIFHNGMSLNKLANEMEIDASTLSRVINSERLFTAKQLEDFCLVLGLTNKERWALQQARYADTLMVDSVVAEPSLSLSTVLDTYPKKILTAWRAGHTQIAFEL